MSVKHILHHAVALDYILAGKSLFTIENSASGNRFTYKVKESTRYPGSYNVKVLTGSDNESSYSFLGTVRKDKRFYTSEYSKISMQAPSFQVFGYVLMHLQTQSLPQQIKIYHHNKCGRCGRTLTVPSSVVNGIGPDCIKMMRRKG